MQHISIKKYFSACFALIRVESVSAELKEIGQTHTTENFGVTFVRCISDRYQNPMTDRS